MLIYDGYRYQRNRNLVSSTRWRCWLQCGAWITTQRYSVSREGDFVKVYATEDHSHLPNEGKIRHDKQRQILEKLVLLNPIDTLKRTYAKEAVQHAEFPEYGAVSSVLKRARWVEAATDTLV